MRSTTNATTSSPTYRSGTPTAAASNTAGYDSNASSICLGEMFIPPLMISSFDRPTTKKYPSPSREAKSPVCSHPSPSKDASVATASL